MRTNNSLVFLARNAYFDDDLGDQPQYLCQNSGLL